jgi:hypothetical protein
MLTQRPKTNACQKLYLKLASRANGRASISLVVLSTLRVVLVPWRLDKCKVSCAYGDNLTISARTEKFLKIQLLDM